MRAQGVNTETQPPAPRSFRRPTLPPPATPRIDGLPAPVVSTSELASAGRSSQLSVSEETVIDGPVADALWDIYAESMGPLDQLAAMKQLETKELTLARFANPEITKIVGWDGDEPVGLGLITQNMDLVGDVSSDFFANTYPDHAARDAIYYGMSVLVKPTQRGLTMFSKIYVAMWQIPAKADGVLIFDVCKFNRDVVGADQIIETIAGNFPKSKWSVIDQQTWFAAELPEPLR